LCGREQKAMRVKVERLRNTENIILLNKFEESARR
jgi:hypothetical protein